MDNNNQGNNQNNNNSNNNDNKKKPTMTAIILILSVLLTFAVWTAYNKVKNMSREEVTYDQFIQMLDGGEVDSVKIYNDEITFKPKINPDSVYEKTYYVIRTDDYNLVERLAAAGVVFEEVYEGGNAIILNIVSYGVMILAFYILMMLIMRQATKSGGIMGINKSNAKMYVEKETGVTFSDVAGQEEAKESLTEIVDFLEKPKKYLEIGAKLPRGALLVGPPGTGKTLLAKAIAGEAKVPFFSISGSEFVEMYVGLGASRVRELFKKANEMAPCIIFIDEIDAIGRSRDTRYAGGDSEREQTLNQLLSEMDGFDTSKGIIILAATNRPEVLDKALLRPGRFDRRIIVSKPDLKGRIDTLKVHSKNVKLDDTVDFKELALATSGAVGADLANIINEGALLAVRNGREYVSQKDFIAAIEIVFAGKEKKEKLLSPKEKRIVAYHEAGHALANALQKNTLPIQRITIVPRTSGALGYVWQVPEEEKQLETKKELEEQIVISLAGRAAEELKFDSVTTGASNDIEKATNIARTMITMYGMSEKFGMVQLEGITGEYLDRRRVLNCSAETETKVDNEVKNLIKASYEKAFKLLKKNVETLDAVAEVLIEKENISGKEFTEIFEKYQNVKLKTKNEDGEDLLVGE
ncbi:MAG: ATP-dependent zinc metalloprotease FtsH [Lachnospiraceae bacterium]|nr:ATP-dependent zinc metalloprotease FtsH [Lachnospiraceae bacterium]